jgi:hypothetical protein
MMMMVMITTSVAGRYPPAPECLSVCQETLAPAQSSRGTPLRQRDRRSSSSSSRKSYSRETLHSLCGGGGSGGTECACMWWSHCSSSEETLVQRTVHACWAVWQGPHSVQDFTSSLFCKHDHTFYPVPLLSCIGTLLLPALASHRHICSFLFTLPPQLCCTLMPCRAPQALRLALRWSTREQYISTPPLLRHYIRYCQTCYPLHASLTGCWIVELCACCAENCHTAWPY